MIGTQGSNITKLKAECGLNKMAIDHPQEKGAQGPAGEAVLKIGPADSATLDRCETIARKHIMEL